MPRKKNDQPEVKALRVLVYGGRGFSEMVAFEWLVLNGERVVKEMMFDPERPYRIKAVVHGGADGADAAGARWGRFLGVDVLNFDAEFKYLGNGAGPQRNKVMADHARIDCAIEFPGDKGTRDMRLRLAGRDIPFFRANVKGRE